MENLIIIGISTTAKTVFQFVQRYSLYNVLGFAVNQEYRISDTFCNLPVFAVESLDRIIDKRKDKIFVAIQWNNLNEDRKNVYINLKKQGFLFANLISPNAIINGDIHGDNCWIADQVVIDFGAFVNNNVFIKVGAYISDAFISDHCFIGAKSLVAGGAFIGEQSFIGLGTIVFDFVKVGNKCIVGAATSLKRNLSDFSVYKTSNNFFVSKQYSSEEIMTKLVASKNIR